MTRKLTFLILALFALIAGPGWGQAPTTYTMTIDGFNNGENNVHWTSTDQASLTWENVTWNTSVTGTTSLTASKTYVQIGSKNNPATNVTIKTDDFAGKTITAVSLTGFCMSNEGPTLTVTAGTSTMIDAIALVKTTSTQYSSASTIAPVTLGDNDFITFSINSTANAAICISEITVTYQGTPSATLDHIGIKTAPAKVTYTEGECFDPTGLVITKYFDDETESDLAYTGNESAFTFNPTLTTPLATTHTQVKITVGGKSANQAITVNAASKYTITFMDRTSQVDQREINQGAAVGELPADPDDIGTYKFQGWAEQFEGTVQDAPAFVTSTTVPTSDMTYYAVYAEISGELQDKSIIYDYDGQHADWILTDGVDKTTYVVLNNGASIASPSIEFTSITSIVINARTFGEASYKKVNAYFNNSLIGSIEAASNSLADYSINEISTTNGNGSFTFSSTTTSSANGPGVAQITINYKEGELNISNYTQNPVAKTLVSIEVSGTPAEFWKGDAFNHDGMTVTANWDDESQTDVTADCEFSTPDMATAGEKEITVTYQGQSDTYTINVQTIENTLETAYTVAQAIAIIDAGKDLATKVYVAGKICQIDSYNSTYKSITYWISTDGSEENMFEVYSGKGLNEADFTSINDIVLQADVVVYGNIKKFNDIYEFDKNNYLVSYTAPEVEKFNINLNQNDHGSISADLETASAGQIVTLTATPIANYHFVEWTVLDGDANEISVTNNQFTMPASDVEVEATFAEDAIYIIYYHYNGDEYTEDIVYEGAIGELEVPSDELLPTGFSFVGWSTSMASTTPIDETYTIDANINLYAIFEKASSSKGQAVTIIDGSQLTSTVTSQDTEMSFDGKTIVVSEGAKQTDVAGTAVNNFVEGSAILIGKNGKYIYNTTAFDNITKFEIYSHKGASTNVAIGVTFSDSPISEYDAESANTWTATLTQNDEVYDASSKLPANAKYFWYQVTNSYNSQVQFRITYGNGSNTTSRYTRVYDNVYSFEGGDLTVEGPSIVVSGYILTVTGAMSNGNAANLIIEDGAQLKAGNDVLATIQKNITGYTGDNDNYYLIANPTDNDVVANLTSNEYDLYSFDPCGDKDGYEWINEEGEEVFVKPYSNEDGSAVAVGYLYANSEDVTLEFAGVLNPAGSTDIELTYAEEGEGREFPGFNLIGNPFACNAYVNGYNFYTMADGEFVINEGSATIAPCEGFFVEATEANQSVTVSTAAPVTAPNALSLNVSQNRGNVIDRAIVRFDGANDLHKFMMNPAHTNLSIAKGGETFAAISTEAEGELPVNFKAEKNGTYTITVNTKNVDAEYLHLIDNMTGMDVDLLSTPSYTFEAKTSDYASRFKLVFGVNNTASESSDSNFAFMSDGNLVIDNIEGEATLQIVDELGRVISTETVSGSYNKALNLKAGLYILNLNGMTQKIVVE